MPRIDFFASLHPGLDPYETGALEADPASADDPQLLAYRSGFWGFATLAPGRRRPPVALEGAATRRRPPRDRVARHIRALAQPPRPAGSRGLARPANASRSAWRRTTRRRTLLERQLGSIRAQTPHHWVCVISDDCSSPDASAALRAAVGDDPRFVVARPAASRPLPELRAGDLARPRRRRLHRALGPGRHVASRQADDAAARDRRRPARLQRRAHRRRRRQHRRRDVLGAARQQPLRPAVAARRELRHRRGLAVPVASCWSTRCRSRRPSSPITTITGSRLTALATGEIAYVPRPLYDYVQHGGAVARPRDREPMVSLRERLRALRRAARERVRHVAAALLRRRLPPAPARGRARAPLRRRAWRRASARR